MNQSTPLAGADGCKTGWLCLLAESTNAPLTAFIAPTFQTLVDRLPQGGILAVDIPIGIPDCGPRQCDIEARRQLGPRRSSVFPAPIRAVLESPSYEQACATRQAIDGKRMSKQAFAITPKIREVDLVLRGGDVAGREVRECHPEVSFALWAGAPLSFAKKKVEGRAERAALIDAVWPGLRENLRRTLPRGAYATDDLHDAFAALWTAARICSGSALVLPAEPELDSAGLSMEIVA